MTSSKPFRILLVDDQETIHEDYRKVLGAQESSTSNDLSRAAADLFGDEADDAIAWEGFELDSALQGQEGFELVQRSIEEGRPYALAFVDIRMPPGWDGIQTVQKIWEVDPEILIVICSAYSDYTWEDMVRQLGRNDRYLILKKPFDNIEVRQCAMALTERWSVSRSDVLTGLLNRRAFQGHFLLEWNRSGRHEFPLACAMVDLDFFKRVNDTLGHQAGDTVLKTVARRLSTHCRSSDYVCRFGGEEICVLLPHTDEDGAAVWAEHARRAIEDTPILIGEREVRATASFGVAQRQPTGDSMEQMLDCADQALMVAKKMGRNQVVRFSVISENEPLRPPTGVASSSGPFSGIRARHLMTGPMACFQATSTVGEAAAFFLQFRINSTPVVDAENRLIGILSEKDLITVLHNEDVWTMPIEKIMHRNVVCYDEETPAEVICEFLSRVAVRRVVIMRDGKPTGVVSRGSLLRWYSNWISVHGGSEARKSPPPEAARARLKRGALAVSQCAAELSHNVGAPAEDLVPPLIDRVSKLQELINDLLTNWHYANQPALFDEDYLRAAGLLANPSAALE